MLTPSMLCKIKLLIVTIVEIHMLIVDVCVSQECLKYYRSSKCFYALDFNILQNNRFLIIAGSHVVEILWSINIHLKHP